MTMLQCFKYQVLSSFVMQTEPVTDEGKFKYMKHNYADLKFQIEKPISISSQFESKNQYETLEIVNILIHIKMHQYYYVIYFKFFSLKALTKLYKL